VNAFELMMAPYIVCHLRLGLALEQTGFEFGEGDRLRVFLTNALELHTDMTLLGVGESAAQEAREAEAVKLVRPISVVLGNPPYERISADTDPTAQWILKGKVPGRESGKSLFDDIRDVARANTIFSHLRSLPDRYVFFWRWALWKAFEHPQSPGILSLITNSTWLSGPGFVGLRKLVREAGEEVWVVDLGGDNRGTHPEPNIFNIETPVAIATVIRGAKRRGGPEPAAGHYRRIGGDSADEKLRRVTALLESGELVGREWVRPASEWMASLVPVTGGADWQEHPALTDLFPWQQPGCLASRTWPIAPDRETLRRRWEHFVETSLDARPEVFATAKTGRNIFTNVPGYSPLANLEPPAKTLACAPARVDASLGT
jgi:predicted helicase